MFDRKFSCSRTAISCVNTGKELKHGSELNMNSNYRHLLSSYDQPLMMLKIRKGQVSCHRHVKENPCHQIKNLGIKTLCCKGLCKGLSLFQTLIP